MQQLTDGLRVLCNSYLLICFNLNNDERDVNGFTDVSDDARVKLTRKLGTADAAMHSCMLNQQALSVGRLFTELFVLSGTSKGA